ncbi:MAG: hypothetical protein JSS02_11930 [Planctomycetes bacterium]|nr:hypothetical protein [Planctomycetota bacterium]
MTTALKQAQQSLEQNDLHEAAVAYRDMRAALDYLGRKDPQARALRQTAAEVIAAAELSDVSLFDLFREAVETTSRSGAAAWSDAFRNNYRGAWVVIDADVSLLSGVAADRTYRVDFPLVIGSERARIVTGLPGLQRVIPEVSARRVVFAAQLDEFRHEPFHSEGDWCVVLRPGTSVLWSSPETLKKVGIEPDEELQRVLAEQARLLEDYQ